MLMPGRTTTKTRGRCVRLDVVNCCQALTSIGPGLRRPSKEARLSNKQDRKVNVIINIDNIVVEGVAEGWDE